MRSAAALFNLIGTFIIFFCTVALFYGSLSLSVGYVQPFVDTLNNIALPVVVGLEFLIVGWILE